MNLALTNPDDAPFEPGRDMRIMLLCINSVTASRAQEILQLIERNFGADERGRLIHDWCDISTLSFFSLREVAASMAAEADVVIVGLHARGDLPWMVEDWMKRFINLRQGRPGALVVVLDTSRKKSDHVQNMLACFKRAAADGGMDFFITESNIKKHSKKLLGAIEKTRQVTTDQACGLVDNPAEEFSEDNYHSIDRPKERGHERNGHQIES